MASLLYPVRIKRNEVKINNQQHNHKSKQKKKIHKCDLINYPIDRNRRCKKQMNTYQ